MNTRTINACMLVSALFLAVATSVALPANTVIAAPKNDTAIAASSKKEVPVSNGHAYGQEKKTEAQPLVEQKTETTKQVYGQPNTMRAVTTDSTAHNPAGNNGFIKVNEEVTPDSIPNNDPHVGCKFKVEFYNYDKNDTYRANVNFAMHNPTAGDGYSVRVSGNTNPFIGEDAAGGGNDLDALQTYTLSFTGEPHPTQGYHVKLTIHADSSQGADVKHKVFWVKPCGGHVASVQQDTKNNVAYPGKTLSTATTAAVLPSTGGAATAQALAAITAGLGASALAYRMRKTV